MRFGDDLHQRDAGAVEIDIGAVGMLVVQALAGVLLHVQSLDADTDGFAILHVEIDLALADDRVLVLADLIALRQIGVEVVLAVEDAGQVDLRLQAEAGAHRLLDAFGVDDRQHAGHAGVDEADLAVGLGAERGRGAGEQFGFGEYLGMDLHADDDLPIAGGALDGLAHDALHHWVGLAVKPDAVSMARAARRMVASSNALPISCRPSGRPLSVRPAGTAMPGRPARFTVTVKMSLRYIDKGSAFFSPTPKAGPGGAAVSRTSQCSYASVKSRAIRVRIFWARA